MSWHDALITIEQAAIWATIGGIVAHIAIRKPLRTILHWLIVQAIHQAQIADSLDTQTDGGFTDLINAVKNNQPPPARHR